VFTNLFRDQLDRSGEVDTVAKAWEAALAQQTTDNRPTLVLNADDPAVAHLARAAQGRVLYYGIDDTSAGITTDEHASDFRTCLECGAELVYTATFYGHIGHWRCAACGNARPTPDIRVVRLAAEGEALAMTIETPDGEIDIHLPLSGVYNAYNALAATAGALALGLPSSPIASALAGFSAAFGRQERFDVAGRDVRVLLGKNPTGLNQVLRTVAAHDGDTRVVFFLNDGIADGRDVSWIWDADYEMLQPSTTFVLAAGTRAEDLALRLKYAGYGNDVPVVRDAKPALTRALEATRPGETLHVVPTYTAMLAVRELLAKMSGRSAFWSDA
jgi:UDP-N-acetylmuramyl tripeptide synthase